MDINDSKLIENGLAKFGPAIKKVARQCLIGIPCDQFTGSWAGSPPRFDVGFQWPFRDDIPPSFVAQLRCQDPGFPAFADGYLFFFYDPHWGYAASDRAHGVVLHQRDERPIDPQELPLIESRRSTEKPEE